MTNKEAIEQLRERLAITDYRQHIPEYYEAIELAVEALEKQAPKKPIDNIEREWFECPTCGRAIVTYYGGKRHHCKCGQALNWEGIK